jgi:hypothetical protein
MLCIDNALTGVGRLERGSNGIWRLIPHEKWGGILTRSSRAEIVSGYRDNSSIIRAVSICFAVIAAGTAAYLLYKHYSKQQQQSPDNNSTARVQCIICLESETIYSLQPCGHLGLCQLCAQTLQSKRRSEELCPLCRAPIQEYQRIFIP